MKAAELRLSNGIECIDVHEETKTIRVIVPEGWKLNAIATDSGQSFDIQAMGVSSSRARALDTPDAKPFVWLTPKRVARAPIALPTKPDGDV